MAKKITMQFGKYVLELKKYRQIKGHDDSIPFEGELYCNGTHIAGCWNDGWGGEAQVKPVLANLALYNEVKKEVEKTNNLFDNPSWFYDMAVVADLLACENERYIWLKETQKKYIIYEKKTSKAIEMVHFSKGGKIVPIKEILCTINGVKQIQKTIAKLTSQGHTILNTNIKYPDIGLTE